MFYVTKNKISVHITCVCGLYCIFLFIPFLAPTGAWGIHETFQFINLGQSVGLLGRGISSSQLVIVEKYGGMKMGRGNRSTRRKPAPAPRCPPQIPLDLNPRPSILQHSALTTTLLRAPILHIKFPLFLFDCQRCWTMSINLNKAH
jgi:hypothetical protein